MKLLLGIVCGLMGLTLVAEAGVFQVRWDVEDQAIGPAGIITAANEHDDFNPVGNPTVVNVTGAAATFTGSSKAISLDGTTDRFDQTQWDGAYNGIDKDLAVLEMYFSPNGLTGGRREILFETGGNGDGLAFGIESGMLIFGAINANSPGRTAGHAEVDLLSPTFSSFVQGADYFYAKAQINAEFNYIQLRVEDKDGNVLSNKQTLLNGSTDFIDWTGGNAAALGGVGGGDYARGSGATGDVFFGGGSGGALPFQGRIASFTLTYSKVPEPSTAAYCALFVGLLATWRNRRNASLFDFMDTEDEGPARY